MDNREIEQKEMFQKKLLKQMKKEIEKLELEQKYSKLINLKNKTIRKLKISTRMIKLGTPFLVTTGIITGGFAHFNQLPFYLDDKKEYCNVMTEYDNLGNVRTQKQYNNELPKNDTQLRYYTKWKLVGEQYVRKIQNYKLKEFELNEIISLLENGNVKLEEILGKPISTIDEVKNSITEAEIKSGAFIRCVIYRQEKEDYILVKQSFSDNMLYTIVYIWALVNVEVIILVLSSDCLIEFSKYVNEIEEKYPILDSDAIMKKLELKRENYHRITRS